MIKAEAYSSLHAYLFLYQWLLLPKIGSDNLKNVI